MIKVSVLFLASISAVSSAAYAQSVVGLPDLSSSSLRAALKPEPVAEPQPFPTSAPLLPTGLNLSDVAAALKTLPADTATSAPPLKLTLPSGSSDPLALNLPPGILSAMGAAAALKSDGPASAGQTENVVLLGVSGRKVSPDSAGASSPWLGAMQ